MEFLTAMGGKKWVISPARKNLWHIKQQKGFYSEDKAQIIKAIKEGFVNVPLEM